MSKETKSCKNCRFDKFDHPITCEFCGDDYTKWQPKEQAPTETDVDTQKEFDRWWLREDVRLSNQKCGLVSEVARNAWDACYSLMSDELSKSNARIEELERELNDITEVANTRKISIDNFMETRKITDNNISDLQQRLDKAVDLLKELDESQWYDAAEKCAGACMMCDANLHPNCMGKHQQLNGEPCIVQSIHDFLADLSGSATALNTSQVVDTTSANSDWIKLIGILCNSLKTPEDIWKFFHNPTSLLDGKTIVECLQDKQTKIDRVLRMATLMFNTEQPSQVESKEVEK